VLKLCSDHKSNLISSARSLVTDCAMRREVTAVCVAPISHGTRLNRCHWLLTVCSYM